MHCATLTWVLLPNETARPRIVHHYAGSAPNQLSSPTQLSWLSSSTYFLNAHLSPGHGAMEALAAISLVGNVLQFAQFVAGIVATAGQVYQTADGVTDATEDLEMIHSRLLNFSAGLQTQVAAGTRTVHTPAAIGAAHVNSAGDLANDLARECKALCDQLLETTGRLRVEKKGNRRLNSFVAAFKTVWNRDRIESLHARLGRFQNIVSLHFLPMLR